MAKGKEHPASCLPAQHVVSRAHAHTHSHTHFRDTDGNSYSYKVKWRGGIQTIEEEVKQSFLEEDMTVYKSDQISTRQLLQLIKHFQPSIWLQN